MAKTGEIDLLLVRSGRTEWDDGGRVQGVTDLPMSESGRSALRASLEDVLHGRFTLSTVYCAPDEASRESARMLAEAAGAKVRVMNELGAMNLGLWEGMLETALEERYPTAWKQWQEDPESVNPPEGETFLEMEVRLLEAMSRIVEKAGSRRVAVVLRPIEFGLACCRLADKPASELCRELEDGPDVRPFVVNRAGLRELAEALRAQV